jgi:tetratricopeptide (TPR) repeat protein
LKKILLSLLVIYLLSAFNIYSQGIILSEDKPLWFRIDDAIQKIESGESGEALYLFRKILNEFPGNPESEMWIGLILDKENEYELSILHLELALEHRKQLVILEDQYSILYKLAEIHNKTGNFENYIINLKMIIDISKEGINSSNLTKLMKDVLVKRGYDKFIELYRPEGKISLKAYALLGKYYYETDDWNKAIEYLMQTTGVIISNVIEEIKNYDPYYIFLIDESTDKSLDNIFDIVNNNSVLRLYFENNSFYEYFYYLAKALIASGNKESGSYILEKIFIRPESGKWGYLSNPR